MSKKPSHRKQAVLLIHGIGEQRPMDTLRGFIETVWTTDRAVHHEHATMGVFSKPDDISGNYELRRLSTTQDRNGFTSDFYEFYWAHMMSGTSMRHVLGWAKGLLFRSPSSLPAKLRGAWYLLVTVLFFAMVFVTLTAMPEPYRHEFLPHWLTALLALAFTSGAVPIIKSFVGDAARYLDASPTNVKRRQEIRARGIEILKKLHEAKVDEQIRYDRIIVAGHSLGSVIGYDILTYAWPSFAPEIDTTKEGSVLDRVEALAANNSLTPESFQRHQRLLMQESRENGCAWRVTDFVTLGSPLTHAEILLAHNSSDLRSKQSERELPMCPPVLEKNQFSFPHNRKTRFLHHAAVFGLTRWTNLYFPASLIVRGDFIGGPIGPVFGHGIRDLAVSTVLRRGFLSHTQYWSPFVTGDQSRIDILRSALNLLDKDQGEEVPSENRAEQIKPLTNDARKVAEPELPN